MKIAISGKQGSGKTTLAEEFIKNHDFKHISFAKAIKETAMKERGLSWEEAFGKDKNREVLQEVGRKKRAENPDYWVEIVMKEIEENPEENYVLDDMRFMSEFTPLKDAGFTMVRIDADESVRKSRISKTFGNPEDVSETDLDVVQRPDLIDFDENKPSWDVFVTNNTISLEQFKGVSNSIYKAFSENTDNV